MIRDAVAFEEKAIPTVTIVHDKFMSAARAQARVLNLPDLPLVSAPQSMPWETPEDERRKASDILDTVVAMLTQPSAQMAKG